VIATSKWSNKQGVNTERQTEKIGGLREMAGSKRHARDKEIYEWNTKGSEEVKDNTVRWDKSRQRTYNVTQI